MAPKRSKDTDWYSVFLEAFSPDGAVQDSSGSPAAQAAAPARPPRNEFERRFGIQQVDDDDDDDDGGGPYFTRAPPPKAAAAGLGPDVDVPSASKGGSDFSPMDEDEADEQGGHVLEKCSKSSPKSCWHQKNDGQADVGLGLNLSSASKAACDSSLMDEDEQGGHMSLKQCSKSGQKKTNCGQLPLNKKKSQDHGGKRKPSVNKRRAAHATDPEESDYERSLPSRVSRRKQGLHNPSSVRSQKVGI